MHRKRPRASLEKVGPCVWFPVSRGVASVRGPAHGLVATDVGLTACRPSPLWAVALGSERGLHVHGKAGSCRGACASAAPAAVCRLGRGRSHRFFDLGLHVRFFAGKGL